MVNSLFVVLLPARNGNTKQIFCTTDINTKKYINDTIKYCYILWAMSYQVSGGIW